MDVIFASTVIAALALVSIVGIVALSHGEKDVAKQAIKLIGHLFSPKIASARSTDSSDPQPPEP